MATQGLPWHGSGHTVVERERQERLESLQGVSEIADTLCQLNVSSSTSSTNNDGANDHHFELTESMSSYELDSQEVREALRVSIPWSELPCVSCGARSLSSSGGPCTSCSARPLSSKEMSGGCAYLRPKEEKLQRASGMGLQTTRQCGADVIYESVNERGGERDFHAVENRGVEGNVHSHRNTEGYLPLNTRDERDTRENLEHGEKPRSINSLEEESGQTLRPCDVQYNLSKDGIGERNVYPISSAKGYSCVNKGGKLGQEPCHESEGCNELRQGNNHIGIYRTRISDKTTRQFDLQSKGTKEAEKNTANRRSGEVDQISNDPVKDFGPLRSKEDELSPLDSDDDDEFYDILIIYHKKDIQYLKQFQTMCNEHGWSTITKDEFPIGTLHFSQFEETLKNCTLAVALITSNFLGDKMADHEHQTALNKSIERKKQNFIPVLYEEGLSLPSYLSAITCGKGYSDHFEKQFSRTMRSAQKKQQRMNGRLNQFDPSPGKPSRKLSSKSSEQNVPAMFRGLQGQLSPGIHAQKFFRDGRFRELCLVLDLCDPHGTPYWYGLAEHIGLTPQDIQWLNSQGRCAANVLEVYCCKHSQGSRKMVLEKLRGILENSLQYLQAAGIVGEELTNDVHN